MLLLTRLLYLYPKLSESGRSAGLSKELSSEAGCASKKSGQGLSFDLEHVGNITTLLRTPSFPGSRAMSGSSVHIGYDTLLLS